MNCAVCGKELNDPAKRNGIKVKIHEDCITENMDEYINDVLSGFLYKHKDGRIMKGYFHKPDEQV
jgi:hypothetical protein